MTTELHAGPILSEVDLTRSENCSQNNDNVQTTGWDPNQQESTSETETSTPISPLEVPPESTDSLRPQEGARRPSAALRRLSELAHRRSSHDEIPHAALRRARTTEDHLHREVRRRFLNDNGTAFGFAEDYGLDELRAPPILPDRERRKSLEYSLARRPTLPKKTLKKRLREDFIVGSWITFLSIWGALARIGISALSSYPGEPVFALIWAQFVGCAVVGFLLQDKTLFPKEDRYIALYIGLTTGFCGSLTSFSSFMWNCFQALANLDPYYPRSNGHNVLALVAQVIITLCVSIAALRFGAHIAQVFRHLLPSITPMTAIKRSLDTVGVVLALAAWTAAAIMTGLLPKWRPELFATVLVPVGALTRWQLSRYNPLIPSFPLGTFAANISATAILGICNLIQSRVRTPISIISCAVLYGIDNGFCGGLSTISTFAVELDTLVRQHAYIYAVVSIFAGISILVLVVGVSAWTQGYTPLCGI